MPIDVLVTTSRINDDPVGRAFIDYIVDNQADLSLTEAILYYDFPAYADYDALTHKPDVVILSPYHGIVVIKLREGKERKNGKETTAQIDDESLAQFTSTLVGRLLKSKILRSGRAVLSFNVTPILFLDSSKENSDDLESELAYSYQGFSDHLKGLICEQPLAEDVSQEIRSVIEGAKALARTQRRYVEDPEAHKYAAALSKLEAEIANFDQKQRRAAIVTIPGPHRIRGLAGSGKTVILAMKAAHLHLNDPDARILITFLTKALKSSIKSLVARFYRPRIHKRSATLPEIGGQAEILKASISRQEKGSSDESVPSAHPRGTIQHLGTAPCGLLAGEDRRGIGAFAQYDQPRGEAQPHAT